MTVATFTTGQAVPWPAAPLGFAQVAELHRSRLVLTYNRGRRVVHPVVSVSRIVRLARQRPLLLALDNPYGRGLVRKTKTYGRPRFARQEPEIRCSSPADAQLLSARILDEIISSSPLHSTVSGSTIRAAKRQKGTRHGTTRI
jgi:hypothetical protein